RLGAVDGAQRSDGRRFVAGDARAHQAGHRNGGDDGHDRDGDHQLDEREPFWIALPPVGENGHSKSCIGSGRLKRIESRVPIVTRLRSRTLKSVACTFFRSIERPAAAGTPRATEPLLTIAGAAPYANLTDKPVGVGASDK